MDKTRADQLVAEVLGQSFSVKGYTRLAAELLRSLDGTHAHPKPVTSDLAAVLRGTVKNYQCLGSARDSDGLVIDVLIVQLEKGSAIEKARRKQRDAVARYLRGRPECSAALVAFVSEGIPAWRLSLVTTELTLRPTGGAQEELTPVRRCSFLVGEGESIHTAKRQIVDLLTARTTPTVKKLRAAFSVEKVSDEFFDTYRDLVERTAEHIRQIEERDTKIRKEFTERGILPIEFAKKLLSQLVFLTFLQRKGWFGSAIGEPSDAGPKNFLFKLFEKKYGGYKNFFNDVLEPLFHVELSSERARNHSSKFNCCIPFLDGGLFEAIRDYDWQTTDILLPNELFANKHQTEDGDVGTGILDVFSRWNFTVQESDPLEQDVAIDPEMLGRIFERLLDPEQRKKEGTYYTSRPIVEYLCRETMRHVINDKVPIKYTPEDMAAVLVGSLPPTVKTHAKQIDTALSNLRVLDPACGSGAFLLGMLQTIVVARERLQAEIGSTKSHYDLACETIEKCLHGVDLSPGACDIARLRLWLALIVEERDFTSIKPLPNLDFKIVCANSLIHPPAAAPENSSDGGVTGSMGFDRDDFGDQLQSAIAGYYDEHSPSGKQESRKRILQIVERYVSERRTDKNTPETDIKLWESYRNIVSGDPVGFFGPAFFFPDVAAQGGFDIVIGNPPWEKVKNTHREFFKRFIPGYEDLETADAKKQAEKLCKAKPDIAREWKLLKKASEDILVSTSHYKFQKVIIDRFGERKTTGGDPDLYKLFLERMHGLVRSKGMLGAVVPGNLNTDEGSTGLRQLLFMQSRIEALTMFENRRGIFTDVHRQYKFNVFAVRKALPEKDCTFSAGFYWLDPHWLLHAHPDPAYDAMDERRIHVRYQYPAHLIGKLCPDTRSIIEMRSLEDVPIVEKLAQFPLLGDKSQPWWVETYSEFHMTNDSDIFNTDGLGWPLFQGKTIHQFDAEYSAPERWVETEKGLKRLGKRAALTSGWRIAWRDIASATNERTLIATILPKEVFTGNKLDMLVTEPLVSPITLAGFCAILNSLVLDYLMRFRMNTTVNAFYMKQMPIPRDPELLDQLGKMALPLFAGSAFEELRNGAKEIGKDKPEQRQELRAKLDAAVAHAYGLTEKELQHVLTRFPLVPNPYKQLVLTAFLS